MGHQGRIDRSVKVFLDPRALAAILRGEAVNIPGFSFCGGMEVKLSEGPDVIKDAVGEGFKLVMCPQCGVAHVELAEKEENENVTASESFVF
jgi:hypothetical protein